MVEPLTTRARALDHMDEIANVWQAIADLTGSRDDLICVDRDNLGAALGFLCRQYATARDAYARAVS